MTDLTQRSRMVIATLALAATLGAAATARAGDAARPGMVRTQVVVDYADLDLDSVGRQQGAVRTPVASGRARVRARAGEHRTCARRSDYRQCQEEALAKAVDRIGSPELQALHARQSADGVG